MCNVGRMKANRVVAAQILSVSIGWVSTDFRIFGKCKGARNSSSGADLLQGEFSFKRIEMQISGSPERCANISLAALPQTQR